MESDAHGSRAPHLERFAGIDLDYDPAVENGWIAAQRVAWVLMTALIVAGLAGVFGRGALSNAQAATPDGAVVIAYERFARNRTPTQMSVVMQAGSVRPVRVVVPSSLLGKIAIQDTLPRPIRQRAVEAGVEFVFAPVEARGRLTFVEQATSPFAYAGSVVVDGQPVELRGFVYP